MSGQGRGGAGVRHLPARRPAAGGFEKDATTIISEPMPPVGTPGRPYPGNRPFAEPGVSASNVGPCGMESYDKLRTNYNAPNAAGGWGVLGGGKSPTDMDQLDGLLLHCRTCCLHVFKNRVLAPDWSPGVCCGSQHARSPSPIRISVIFSESYILFRYKILYIM